MVDANFYLGHIHKKWKRFNFPTTIFPDYSRTYWKYSFFSKIAEFLNTFWQKCRAYFSWFVQRSHKFGTFTLETLPFLPALLPGRLPEDALPGVLAGFGGVPLSPFIAPVLLLSSSFLTVSSSPSSSFKSFFQAFIISKTFRGSFVAPKDFPCKISCNVSKMWELTYFPTFVSNFFPPPPTNENMGIW